MGPPEGEHLSFSEKKKYFEKEIEDHNSAAPKAKEGKRFTYLSADEVAKLKLEDERRKGSMSQEALQSYVADSSDPANYSTMITNIAKRSEPMDLGHRRTSSRSSYEKFKRDSNSSTGSAGSPTDESEPDPISEQQRALEAEKKAMWRKARNQALEEDARRAQAHRKTCPQTINRDMKDKSKLNSLETEKKVP